VPLADIDRQIRDLLAQMEGSHRGNPELHLQALAVLAMTEGAERRDQAAIASAGRAAAEADRLYVHDDPTRIYYHFVLALVSMRQHPADALQGFREAIADYDKSIGTPGPSLAALLGYFGGALAQVGRTTDAVSALERSTRIAAHYADASPDFYLGTLNALAQQYLELGRDADAASLLLPRLGELRQRAASRSVWAVTNLAGALDTLGAVALHRGRPAQAEQYFRQARDGLDTRGQQVAPDSYAASLVGLGDVALARGQVNQASVWLAAVQGFNQRSHPAAQSLRALDASWLQARVALAQGNFREATGVAATAEAVAARHWGVCSRRVQALRELESTARSHMPSTTLRPVVACPVEATVAAN
jgi:serine/threonine-protein kinase